ncbi:hypothetical protein CI610_03325 [invertebrate metagenome]|uniref:Uncharacterized protein n=1 Tax=invertebrate metagenome TaxID=1711999 RepID=A0A2H9T3I5_9ZZZZ
MVRVVSEIWNQLDQTRIQALYESIPKRIQAVIKAKGCITKY